MSTLPLNDVVDVSLSVGPVTSVRSNFNLGLIVGKSTIIGTTDRVKTYTKIGDLTADGWTGDEPEYLAVQKYFSQSPKPSKVAVGRWDGTNETAVQAVTACREANSEWYACSVCDAEKNDIIAVATYIDSCTPESTHFATTNDSDVLAGTSGNLLETLKKNGVHRTLVQYSSIPYAVAAIMGYAMAANTQTSGSAYTLKFKPEVGVSAESLNSTQVTIIKNNNGNVYINRGSVYNLFEEGVTCDGTHFDEIINLDVLTNNLQAATINSLIESSKIAQTDAGMDLLLNNLTTPLEKARTIGFIKEGVWTSASVLTVNTGDTLTRGYKILADSISNQTQSDREARKAPPIYILAKLSGAIENASIKLYVNR
jgi:hypothetical protein